MNIPNEYFPAIEKAFHDCTKKGPLTGFPMVGIRYVLKDGQTHSVDSSSYAFGMATKFSFEHAYKEALPTILEPIMSVEINVPTEYSSPIIASVIKRGGNIVNTTNMYGNFRVDAEVPL